MLVIEENLFSIFFSFSGMFITSGFVLLMSDPRRRSMLLPVVAEDAKCKRIFTGLHLINECRYRFSDDNGSLDFSSSVSSQLDK